jgi:hypothetical protein
MFGASARTKGATQVATHLLLSKSKGRSGVRCHEYRSDRLFRGNSRVSGGVGASTTALAADSSLVVALGPNSSLPAPAVVAATVQMWVSSTVGTAASVNCTGYNTAIASFNTSGTVTAGAATLQVSDDGGTTW